jgi:long-chain acyl-CoA synthetase
MVLAASPASVLSTAQETHPTFINGVPFFYERLVTGLAESLQDRGGHRSPGVLRAALGQQIEQCSCGGAAVSTELVDYFQEQQVHLLPGYGLSEAAPVVTASTPQKSRRGTVGLPLPNTEVRLALDGEILVRGPQVMLGYYRDEQQSRVALRDGWLHTGDLGQIDRDGYLTISGRSKEIIATKQGKKIPPLPLEAQLAALPLIDQIMVIGDERDYLTALVVPHLQTAATLLEWSNESSSDPKFPPALLAERSLEQACQRVELQQAIAAQIASAQRLAARHERIRKVALIAARFTVENGQLTSKLSLRRAVIAAQHGPVIAAMYAHDQRVSSWCEISSSE